MQRSRWQGQLEELRILKNVSIVVLRDEFEGEFVPPQARAFPMADGLTSSSLTFSIVPRSAMASVACDLASGFCNSKHLRNLCGERQCRGGLYLSVVSCLNE